MRFILTFIAMLVVLLPAVRAEDWPSYRHDYARSGVTDERIDARALAPIWRHESDSAPVPAWPGPAKWDAYASLKGLRSMRNYDAAFQPIAVEGYVYFASNADDSVHCLDAASGRPRWTFTADGPIRIAPAWHEGRLYFGADDGYAYCIDGQSGNLVWRFSPTADESESGVLNNGRLISFWPVRTGVVVVDGTAYFGASLLPWKESYLCAVDARTGRPDGDDRYVRRLGLERTLEGALLSSGNTLVIPQGRVAPMLFDRATGEPEGLLPGGGGSFVLLTEDERVLHGPGNKAGWITDSAADSRAQVASYDRGTGLVVRGGISYLLRPDALGAIDRETQQPVWATPCEYPHAIIMAAETLFLGGDDEVAALDGATGEILWTGSVRGRAHGLAVANGLLIVSTDEGEITAFRPGTSPVATRPARGRPEAAPPSPAIDQLEDPGLLDRWVFQRNSLVKEGPPAKVANLAREFPALSAAATRFEPVGSREAVTLNGADSGFSIAEDFRGMKVPGRGITAEAWVRIDEGTEWGGIVGVMQDNGAYERGWILGYRGLRPGFALAGVEGGDGITWITSADEISAGEWIHVAGTYDGGTMRLFVNGEEIASATSERGAILYPDAAPYHVGGYRDADEHYRLQGMLHEVVVYDRALTHADVASRYALASGDFPEAKHSTLATPGSHPAVGPYLVFDSPASATIRWSTETPHPTRLLFHRDGADEVLGDLRPKTDHEVTVTGLRRERVYTYSIEHDGSPGVSPVYECDLSFNYTEADPVLDVPADPRVRLGIDALGEDRGIAVVLGVQDASLLEAIVAHTRMKVIAFETDPGLIASCRKRLLDAGIYGHRAAIQPCDSLSGLATPDAFADLVFCDPARQSEAGVLEEIGRILQPSGGVALLERGTTSAGGISAALEEGDRQGCAIKTRSETGFTLAIKGVIPGSGAWTHMYGSPDNAAYAGESLAGIDSTDDLEVSWVGRPGPRYQSDRGNRKPSPLAIDGRLYMQGLNRIIAVDSYNGTILWSIETPTVQRFNVPRDCSNWCADEHRLYVAARDRVWSIDGRTGEVETSHPVLSPTGAAWASEWGYLASVDDKLVGSGVKEGSSFTNWWGPESWYDGKDGEPARKISSDNLFAVNKETGSPEWRYENGVIMNPTVTVVGDRVVFVENRSDAIRRGETRRLDGDALWQDQHLVALDARTGEPAWERPIAVIPGISAFYLAASGDKLVIVSSQGGRFGVYGYDAADGGLLWARELPWEVDHHGKHLSRPAIVNGRVIIRPYVLDLASGQDLPLTFPPGHQCGTYTCSDNAIFLRAGNLSVWSHDTNERTEFNRVRPDCWISTIPANGMLLSPEGGGGCSCGSWIEVSMGLLPVAD